MLSPFNQTISVGLISLVIWVSLWNKVKTRSKAVTERHTTLIAT